MIQETRVVPAPVSETRVDYYRKFIEQRRQNGEPAKLFMATPENAEEIAALIAAGGIVVLPWWQRGGTTLFMATCHDHPHATRHLNEIKGRPPTQTLGISYLGESIRSVADIDSSRPLKRAVGRLGKDPIEILDECYRHSVGLVFKAKGDLPEAVTATTQKGKTVLVMGAINDEESEYDVYNDVLNKLFTKHRKAIAGTSANPSGRNVYALAEQEEAYREFQYSVDGFVKAEEVPAQLSSEPPMSSTLIDVSGEVPIIVRKGSTDLNLLRRIFPDLRSPEEANYSVPSSRAGLIKRKMASLIGR